MRTIVFTLFAALSSAATAAQADVCITGRVAPVNGPTICQQGETHLLENTRVFLRSATIDLNQWIGRLVRVRGSDIGVTCTVLQVREVSLAGAALTRCGSPSPGCAVKLVMCPGGLGRWWLWAAFAPGYRPIACAPPDPLEGTVLIADPLFNLVFGEFIGLCGEYLLPIPADPSLIGVRVWFQGARQDIGPVGPLHISNVEVMTLSPLLPPCQPTNC
jgi:hypothetical protein